MVARSPAPRAVQRPLREAPAWAGIPGPTRFQASMAVWPRLLEAPVWPGTLGPTKAAWPLVSMAMR